MAINLLSLLNSVGGSGLAGVASQLLGETPATTQTALTTAYPAILGAVVQQGSTTQGATQLLSKLASSTVDPTLATDAATALGTAPADSIVTQGATLARGLFGDRLGGISDTLASIAGMRGASASKLMFVAVPMVFSFLKKHVVDNGLDAGGLRTLLASQAGFIQDKIDPRLASAAGLSAAAQPRATRVSERAEPRRATLWPWVALAAVVLLAFFVMRRPRAPATASQPVPAAADSHTATAAAELAPAAPPVASFPVRILFPVGSSTLDADGRQAIDAAAQSIKDGGVKVDITGYTDASGNAAANQKLAKDRAVAVRDELTSKGVPAGQINMRPPANVEAGGTADEARRVEITTTP